MHPFEEILYLPGTNDYRYEHIVMLICGSLPLNRSCQVDITGCQVELYAQIINICDIVSNDCF